jgi:hypothetical protein
MSAICVMGESGSGKTTSARHLNPKTTYYIDADKKGLSWRGWKRQYNTEAKNYFASDDPDAIKAVLLGLPKKRPEIKVVIIDTINGIMVGDEMRRSKEKGYDKWVDLAQSVWDIVDIANTLPFTVAFMAHAQSERDDSGFVFTRIKTSGRKLDKIVLESKFTTVLLAKCVDGRYQFETHAKNSTAKSPMGLFDEQEIDNDLASVLAAIEAYETEDGKDEETNGI